MYNLLTNSEFQSCLEDGGAVNRRYFNPGLTASANDEDESFNDFCDAEQKPLRSLKPNA